MKRKIPECFDLEKINDACEIIQRMYREREEDIKQDLWVLLLRKKILEQYRSSKKAKLTSYLVHCFRNYMISRYNNRQRQFEKSHVQMSIVRGKDAQEVKEVGPCFWEDGDPCEALEGLDDIREEIDRKNIPLDSLIGGRRRMRKSSSYHVAGE